MVSSSKKSRQDEEGEGRKDREEEEKGKKGRREKKEKRSHRRRSESGERPSKQRRSKSPSPAVVAATSSSKSEVSLSIEESNALRAKLGLKPLRLDDDKPKPGATSDVDRALMKSGDKVVAVDGRDEVHRAADNMAAKKKADSLRERLNTQRDRRKLLDKLRTVRTLADESDEEGDSSRWVERNRHIEEERKRAEERERELAQMDEEFGVSEVISREVRSARPQKARGYTGRDLVGLTVGHAEDAFLDGKDQILVLADKDVLDDTEGETLVNPTMQEMEMWTKNAELRKKKPNYNPYEDEQDPLKAKGILSKYDEEIDGEKKHTITIGSRGGVDLSGARHETSAKDKLKAMEISLDDSNPLRPAVDYFTSAEMAAFKKPKKKRVRKIRKTGLTADDLLKDTSAEVETELRSRKKTKKPVKEEEEAPTGASTAARPTKVKLEPMDVDRPTVSGADDDDDVYQVSLEDEEAVQQELSQALSRARQTRLAVQHKEEEGERGVKVKMEQDDTQEDDIGGVVLDTMGEYCRGLGDIPTFGLAGNREGDELEGVEEQRKVEESSDSDAEEAPRKKAPRAEKRRGNWVSEDVAMAADSSDEEQDQQNGGGKLEDAHAILDEEQIAGSSVAAALKLASIKGYIEKDKDRPKENAQILKLKHMEAKRFSVMEKSNDGIDNKFDDKYSRKLERLSNTGGGMVQDFKEKTDYKPEIILNYIDKKGRHLNPKQAFAHLSWEFHGKGPGSNKIDKLERKWTEANILASASSTDTPLNTLEKQKKKQEHTQLPYIMLSSNAATSHSLNK